MKFRKDINGLRAIAVSVVVLFHFGVTGFQGGFIGVDVFFVISGYLMTGIIFSKLNKDSFFILDFYLDRVKRIVPALSVLCLILLILGWFILLPAQYSLLGKHAATSISFLSNIFYWKEFGYFDAAAHSKWLLHTWSLSVEWQFYILYPLAIVSLKYIAKEKHLKIYVILFSVISYILSIILTKDYPSGSFFLLPTRAWEMLVGGIVFLYPVKLSNFLGKICEYLGLVTILFSSLFFSEADLWPGYLAIVPVTGTILVLIANNQASIFTNNKVSQWLGTASYSIYLWHWPVVVLLSYLYLEEDNISIMLGVIVSLFLGYTSYFFIESKAHYLKYSLGRKTFKQFLSNRAFIFGSFLVLVTGISGSYIKLGHGISSRLPSEVINISSESSNKNPRSKECNVYPFSELKSPGCIYGNKNNLVVIVLGDSHSNAVVTAIEDSLKSVNGGALFLGADGCFSLINTTSSYFNNCNIYNEWVRNEIASNAALNSLPIIIINRTSGLMKGIGDKSKVAYIKGVKRGTPRYLETFTKEYKEIICKLNESNPIYLVQPIPEMIHNVPEYVAKMKLFGREENLNLPINNYNKRNVEAIDVMNEIKSLCGVELLDPVQYLCTKNSCSATVNSRPLYYDDDHLSEYGNRFLVPMFDKIWSNINKESQLFN